MEVETKKVIPMYVPKPNKSSPFLGHLALTKGGGFIRDRHAQTKGREARWQVSLTKVKAESGKRGQTDIILLHSSYSHDHFISIQRTNW